MGFAYFDGMRWNEITREERFFCQRLYQRIDEESPERFVAYLRDAHGLEIDGGGEWEAGYEVCFYRDLWHLKGRPGRPYSPKRTFDLCLFGQRSILIIEAKAAVEFTREQTDVFHEDLRQVALHTGIADVRLLGLCSSRCPIDDGTRALFNGPIFYWKDLAAHYGGDEILQRADDVYEPGQAFAAHGRHADTRLSGQALFDAARGGPLWWVGRSGGLHGEAFLGDVRTGRWRKQNYEVNTTAAVAPSPNWFAVAAFAQAVERG